MKKLFVAFVVAGSLAACNNSGTSSETVKDSVIDAIDSTKEVKVDSVKESADSLKDKVNATFEKTDSANKKIADSAKTK